MKRFDFKRVFPCFFLTALFLTVPAFAAYLPVTTSCAGCGAEVSCVPPSFCSEGHDFGVYLDYTCRSCGFRHRADVSFGYPGHVFTSWNVVSNPTCTEDGAKRAECENCEVIDEELISALGHDWSEISRTEATSSAPGSLEYECAACHETKTEILPQLPAEPAPSPSESLSLTALLQTMTEVFSMACGWMEAVCLTVVSHPILLLGVVIGFIGTGVGLFSRLLNL